MVMAQCYCGGYARTIFAGADATGDLADGLRCGFFAQQHDLPAAGCRPDISNDREYSSYFWGAIAGCSRSGEPITSADRDGDGSVSLAEAHIHAVLASETIDIPLRCSEALLRAAAASFADAEADAAEPTPAPAATLGQLLEEAAFVESEIIRGLAERLSIALSETGEDIRSRLQSSQRQRRLERRRGRKAYREMRKLDDELRDEIVARWPECEKADSFAELEQVGIPWEGVESGLAESELFQEYAELYRARARRRARADESELRQVKLKRLLQAIESVTLARRLAAADRPDLQLRYQQILELERSTL
jgi:hypothetical protein